MTGLEIATAFNTHTDSKTWTARSVGLNRKGSPVDMVRFESVNGMVSLDYNVEDGKFAVKFRKFQGAWGDYTKAISRSLFVVLNTLKRAGLPFDAPPTLAGCVITATTTDDTTVHVSFAGPPANPIMPELRNAVPENTNVSFYDSEGLRNAAKEMNAWLRDREGKLPPVL